jgi:hypothetical protein
VRVSKIPQPRTISDIVPDEHVFSVDSGLSASLCSGMLAKLWFTTEERVIMRSHDVGAGSGAGSSSHKASSVTSFSGVSWSIEAELAANGF